MDETEEAVCRTVHEALRAFARAHGEKAAPPWEEAPAWMKEATRAGVAFRVEHPESSSASQHDQWMEEKLATGWTYGQVKDAKAKTHPSLVPYDKLPEREKRKDALFAAVVAALTKPL